MATAENASTPRSDDDPTIERLAAAVRRRFGEAATLERIERATLGGSNQTILFDLVEGGSSRRLVFRQETYTLDPSPFLPPSIQYRLMAAAYRHGVPVPEPVFELVAEDRLGRGYVMSCVHGESMPKVIMSSPQFAQARSRFASQCGEILARIHSIPITEVAELGDEPASHDPLAFQRRQYEGYGRTYPALELGFRWLELNRPKIKARRVLHGDFRNGNMIMDDTGIRAVLDWECAFVGSAMADFAWLCLRSWRFGVDDLPVGGIGERDELYAAYQQNGGSAIDDEALRWWDIYGHLRWALFNVMQVHGHLSGGRRSPAFAACGRNVAKIEYDLLNAIKNAGF